MKKSSSVSSYYIETSLDLWLAGASNGDSGEFSEYARENGRAELKQCDNVNEYALYRFFHDLDRMGSNDISQSM